MDESAHEDETPLDGETPRIRVTATVDDAGGTRLANNNGMTQLLIKPSTPVGWSGGC